MTKHNMKTLANTQVLMLGEERRFNLALASSITLLVGSLVALSACTQIGGSMPTPPTLEDDLRAIEALNQHDVKAALANDMVALTSQWTDDFVVLPPSGPILRGRQTIAATAEQRKEKMTAIEPLEYIVEFEEIKILGDYAYEWGTYRGSMRPRAGGEKISYGGKLMRILERQRDGSWKMHRTMMTND
jgi:uncharacterized protein (TIGR02246 family)